MGPGEYTIGDLRVVVDENLATWSADRSHLMGSAGTMRRSEENLRRNLRLTDDQIKKLMIDNPRRILGVDP
jgi:N-acetylglucosamine-6-phosphate deacetylase